MRWRSRPPKKNRPNHSPRRITKWNGPGRAMLERMALAGAPWGAPRGPISLFPGATWRECPGRRHHNVREAQALTSRRYERYQLPKYRQLLALHDGKIYLRTLFVAAAKSNGAANAEARP